MASVGIHEQPVYRYIYTCEQYSSIIILERKKKLTSEDFILYNTMCVHCLIDQCLDTC